MAIDTADKRSAAILHRRVVQPDGSLDTPNRYALAMVYFEEVVVPLGLKPGDVYVGVLGCPQTEIYLMEFCGNGIVADLTDTTSFAKYARELDDDSELEVTLHLTGDGAGQACCEVLSNTRTWRHELIAVRGGEVAWGPGPLVTISVQREIAHLVSRDIVAWLDVRLVHNDYNFEHVDLTTIARTCIEDALTQGPASTIPHALRDACILDNATFWLSGKTGDLEVVANQRTAGEVLRDLANQGLDFTVLKRSLIVGADFAFGPIGPLRDEHFLVDIEVTEHGLAAATDWHVSGGEDTVGHAGGVDPYFGLIERAVEGEAASNTVADLDRMAAERLAGSNPPPLTVNIPSGAGLSAEAPVTLLNLVPGSLVDLDVQETCRPALIRQRLTAVEFRSDDNGEQVSVTIGPSSDTALAEETG